MNKEILLENLVIEIQHCPICKEGKSGEMVFGEGNPDAKVMFVGEAPGKQEALSGRPFIGRSGKLLRLLINEVGLIEQEIYITSPVKYLPDRGTPSATDIAHAKLHFDKQLAIIDPEYVVLLGAVAAKATLRETIAVKKRHGEVIVKNGRKYFITFHPAAALRFPPLRKELADDFNTLKTLIKSKNTSYPCLTQV